MYVHLALAFFSLLIMLFVNNKEKGLKWVFFIVTAVLCVRYQWGNDYLEYLDRFSDWSSERFSLFNVDESRSVVRNEEFGWVILNRLFAITGLGFFGLVIALTIFENWVIRHIIVKYVEPQYYWVSVSFWLFSTSFCVNASMMRQFLCICLYLIVVDLMLEKKKGYLWWSIGIILLGATFHRSNVALLATLPLFYVRFKLNRKTTIWLVVLALMFAVWRVFGQSLIEPYVLSFVDNSVSFSVYMSYVGEEKATANTGLGVIFRYIIFIVWLILICGIEDNKKQTIIFLGIVSYFFEPIQTIVPLASRFTRYFAMTDMLRWAYLFEMAKKKPLLYVFFVVQVLFMLKEIPEFYYSSIWINKCLEFHTIFEAPSWM